jgi:hypothetical protein
MLSRNVCNELPIYAALRNVPEERRSHWRFCISLRSPVGPTVLVEWACYEIVCFLRPHNTVTWRMAKPAWRHHVSGLKLRMIYDLQINMNGAAFPEVFTVLCETELVSCLEACNREFAVCCRISDCKWEWQQAPARETRESKNSRNLKCRRIVCWVQC